MPLVHIVDIQLRLGMLHLVIELKMIKQVILLKKYEVIVFQNEKVDVDLHIQLMHMVFMLHIDHREVEVAVIRMNHQKIHQALKGIENE